MSSVLGLLTSFLDPAFCDDGRRSCSEQSERVHEVGQRVDDRQEEDRMTNI